MNKKRVECMFCGRHIWVQRGTTVGFACSNCKVRIAPSTRSRTPGIRELRRINTPDRRTRLAPILE